MDSPSNSTCYSINRSGEIVAIGGDWDRFVHDNDSPLDLLSANILHRSFWEFISGDALQRAYRGIMSSIRAGESLDFAFRCDSPALRRFLKLRMTPAGDGGIEFVIETICTEQREFQPVFDANAQRVDGIVVACSWCNKLRTDENVWREPEDAIRQLALFETDAIPALSHGMCDGCYESVMNKTKPGWRGVATPNRDPVHHGL